MRALVPQFCFERMTTSTYNVLQAGNIDTEELRTDSELLGL